MKRVLRPSCAAADRGGIRFLLRLPPPPSAADIVKLLGAILPFLLLMTAQGTTETIGLVVVAQRLPLPSKSDLGRACLPLRRKVRGLGSLGRRRRGRGASSEGAAPSQPLPVPRGEVERSCGATERRGETTPAAASGAGDEPKFSCARRADERPRHPLFAGD